MTERIYYDCDPGQELLYCLSIGDAVEEWADRMADEPLPETVTVYAFTNKHPGPHLSHVEALASNVIEQLSEEWAHPDIEASQDPEIENAVLEFAEKVTKHFTHVLYHPTDSIEVRVADYLPAEQGERRVTPFTTGSCNNDYVKER